MLNAAEGGNMGELQAPDTTLTESDRGGLPASKNWSSGGTGGDRGGLTSGGESPQQALSNRSDASERLRQDLNEARGHAGRDRALLTAAVPGQQTAVLTVSSLMSSGVVKSDVPGEPSPKPSLLATGLNRVQQFIWAPSSESQLAVRDEITRYSTSFLKTASLFAKGRGAYGAAALVFAADEVRPEDRLKDQGIDLVLGLTKGATIKFTLDRFSKWEWNPAAKGAGIGTASRVIDNLLSRKTYLDHETGAFAPSLAPGRILTKTFDDALAMDILVFVSGDMMLSAAGKQLAGREFLKTTLGGTFFGLSSGLGAEWMRQKQNGEFDLAKLAMRGALQAGADTLGAAAAGRYNMRFNRSSAPVGERRLAQNDAIDNTPVTASGVRADHLNLVPKPPQNLPALRTLLGAPEVVVEMVKLPPAPEAPVSSVQADYRASLPQQPVEMNVYKPQGLPEIALPKAHDAALNEVRQLRYQANRPVSALDPAGRAARDLAARQLEVHPLRDALLPEELLPTLAQLPSPPRRVVISEKPNPDDPFYAKQHGNSDFTSLADASSTGEMTLFQPRRSRLDHGGESSVKGLALHEWAHHLRWGKPDFAQQFDRATGLEPDTLASNYNRSSGDEMWSKNLSDLLHSDARVMTATAERLPLRSMVLARALSDHLASIAPANRGKYHDIYVERARLIEDIAGPRARDLLVSHMRVAQGVTQASAGRLLLELGFDGALQSLGPVASLDLSRTPVTDATLRGIAGSPVETLRLTGTAITDGIGPVLATLPRLRVLRVDSTQVSDGLLLQLATLHSLRTIYTGQTNMSPGGLSEFGIAPPDVQVHR